MTKKEIFTIFFIIFLFGLVLSRYFGNLDIQKLITDKHFDRYAQSELTYWTYILNHEKYFPGSRVNFSTQGLTLVYDTAPPAVTTTTSMPVLVYHGISSHPRPEDITIDRFNSQLAALKKLGYQTVSLDEFTKFGSGKTKPHSKLILITFDDGQKDAFYHADPTLRALGYQATNFIITNKLSLEHDTYYISEDEIKNATQTNRWQFASHGHKDHQNIIIDAQGTTGHFLGNRMFLEQEHRLETDEELERRIATDLTYSKNKLASITDKPVTSFAFPYGDFGQYSTLDPFVEKTVRKLTNEIYHAAFIQFRNESKTGYFSQSNLISHDSNFYKRILIDQHLSDQKLLQILESGSTKTLPYTVSGTHGIWITQSSQEIVKATQSGQITLTALPSKNSTAAYLDGSQNWTDYQVSATFNPTGANQIGIISRNTQDASFVSCIFGLNQIYIATSNHGTLDQLEVSRNFYNLTDTQPAHLSMRVDSNTVSCLIDDKIVVRSPKLTPDISRGGIGFAIWGDTKRVPTASISDITIQNL